MKKEMFVMIVALFMSACISSVRITELGSNSPSSKGTEEEIAVIKEGEAIAKPYQKLGKLFAQKRGSNLGRPSEKALAKMLKTPAWKMGADAIIGFHTSNFDGKQKDPSQRWAGGIAVKFVDGKLIPAGSAKEFIVAILPLLNKVKVDSAKKLEDDAAAREAAQFHLEKAGYYAVISKDISKALTLDEIKNMDTNSLKALGGPETDMILFIALEQAGSTNIGLAGGGEATIGAVLISKKNRNIVWTSQGEASNVTLGLLPTLLSGGHRKKAIYSAINKTFKSMTRINEEYVAPSE